MRLRQNITILVAPVICLFIACSLNDQTIPGSPVTLAPGAFALSRAEGLAKAQATTGQNDSDTIVFNLDTVRASRDFYFILLNSGQIDIDSISVSTTNAAFTVTPGLIQKLKPSGASALGTIIRVTAVHGIALDGVGTTDPLPPGENSSVISIAGITHDNHSAQMPVACLAKLQVFALLMDIALLDSLTNVDLSKPQVHAACTEGSIGFADGYSILKGARLVNTGNVPIEVFWFSNYVSSIPNKVIRPGDTASIAQSILSNGIFVKLFGHNTITDPARLRMGNDGAAYIYLTGAR